MNTLLYVHIHDFVRTQRPINKVMMYLSLNALFDFL